MSDDKLRDDVERVVNEAEAMKEEGERFYEELGEESDRGAAILAAEYFDERLRNAIEKKILRWTTEYGRGSKRSRKK